MSLARQGNHSSLGHRVDVSAIDVNDVPLNKYLHEVTCEQNIISLQPPGAKCVNRADLRNGHSQGLIPDSFSLMHGRDAENGYSARTAFDKSDMVQGPLPRTCREELKADGLVLERDFQMRILVQDSE
ncbi:hypothetical protein ACFX15_044426 [Malus domestica]